MSDRKPSSTSAAEPERPEFVIPDGGLGTSMPEWLLQRPDWASAPAAPEVAGLTGTSGDVAVVGAVPAVDDAEVTPKVLPPPDTTPIQLADVLTVEDLPDWLRSIAARSEQDRLDADTAPEAVATSGEDVSQDMAIATSEPALVAQEGSSPVAAASDNGTSRPAWLSEKVIGALIAAVVLIVLYMLLSLFSVI